MGFSAILLVNSIFLGIGLAMDAFSVSIADAIANPDMKKRKFVLIAFFFGLFQTIMPLIGWFCVTKVASYFIVFQRFIPYIALVLLLYIGIKMLIESIKGKEEEGKKELGLSTLFIQAIAISIDALSVGFAFAEYSLLSSVVSSLIIGVETFLICIVGLLIGKVVGKKLLKASGIIGGIILILIGLEIFIRGILGA